MTTTTYVPRAKYVGVPLVDGEELREWEHRARRIVKVKRVAIATSCISFIVYCTHDSQFYSQNMLTSGLKAVKEKIETFF